MQEESEQMRYINCHPGKLANCKSKLAKQTLMLIFFQHAEHLI